MDFLHILILSVVQGITEFLPISSSAHLILMPRLMGWADQGVIFDIAVHVGTLFAVMIYFKRDTVTLFRGYYDFFTLQWGTDDAKLLLKLVYATIPLIIFALFVKDFVTEGGRSLIVLGGASIIFGVLLGYADRLPSKCVKITSLDAITAKNAWVFGLFQALAVIPGTSRSGICMTAGRMLGCDRATANHFGTLMAIPVITIAALFSITDMTITDINWLTEWRTLTIAAGLAFLTALGGIHILMTWVSRIGYTPFVIYRIILGAFLLWLAF